MEITEYSIGNTEETVMGFYLQETSLSDSCRGDREINKFLPFNIEFCETIED